MIVGAPVWIYLHEKAEVKIKWAPSYVTAGRFRTPEVGGFRSVDIEAVSEPLKIGEFRSLKCSISRFEDVPIKTRMEDSNQLAVLPKLVVRNQNKRTHFDISFLNCTDAPIEVCDPFLQYRGMTDFPGSLRIVNTEGKTVTLLLPAGVSYAFPSRRMCRTLRTGAIAGRSMATELQPGKHVAHLTVDRRILFRGRPFRAANGCFTDHEESGAIFTSSSDPFFVQ